MQQSLPELYQRLNNAMQCDTLQYNLSCNLWLYALNFFFLVADRKIVKTCENQPVLNTEHIFWENLEINKASGKGLLFSLPFPHHQWMERVVGQPNVQSKLLTYRSINSQWCSSNASEYFPPADLPTARWIATDMVKAFARNSILGNP